MQSCNTCGGSIQYINYHIGKCEYCGRLYSIQDGMLTDANPEELYHEASALASGTNANDAQKGISMLEALGSYKDSASKALAFSERIESAKAEEQARNLEEQRKAELKAIEERKLAAQKRQQKMTLIIIGVSVLAICSIVISFSAVSNNRKKAAYEEALSLYGQEQYEDALEKFENLKNYSDSAEYVVTISKLMDERNETYGRAVNYFQNSQYANAIKEFSSCISHLDSKEYIDKASEKIYLEAKSEYQSENYKKAKELLESVPAGTSASNSALVLLSEVDETIKGIEDAQKYAQALAYYENQEYEAAQKIFIELDAYEDSISYLTQIGESIYQRAEALYNQREYSQCGDQIGLIDTEEKWSGYTRALDLKQQASDAYQSSISVQAKNICRKEGSTSMNSFIDDSVCSVLSKDEAKELKESCFVKAIALNTMEPYVTGYFSLPFESATDIFGNSYSSALLGYMEPSDDVSNTYLLDQKYSILTATVAVYTNSKSDKGSASIQIYGDDRLIWSDNQIRKGAKPYDIEVDISGITDLKIEMHGWGTSNGSGLRVLLGNPTLSE